MTDYQVVRRRPGAAEYSMVESVVHVGGLQATHTDANPTQNVLHVKGGETLARTQFVIARSVATWRSRHPKDGPSSNEIATLRSQ